MERKRKRGNLLLRKISEEVLSSEGVVPKVALSYLDEGNMAKVRGVMGGKDPQTAYIEAYTLKEDGNVVLRVFRYSK